MLNEGLDLEPEDMRASFFLHEYRPVRFHLPKGNALFDMVPAVVLPETPSPKTITCRFSVHMYNVWTFRIWFRVIGMKEDDEDRPIPIFHTRAMIPADLNDSLYGHYMTRHFETISSNWADEPQPASARTRSFTEQHPGHWYTNVEYHGNAPVISIRHTRSSFLLQFAKESIPWTPRRHYSFGDSTQDVLMTLALGFQRLKKDGVHFGHFSHFNWEHAYDDVGGDLTKVRLSTGRPEIRGPADMPDDYPDCIEQAFESIFLSDFNTCPVAINRFSIKQFEGIRIEEEKPKI